MILKERQQRLKAFSHAYEDIIEVLKQFPKEMWKYKPSEKEWSIHEILIHLADSEANGFVRCRRFIAEPGSKVMAYDQDAWAGLLDYHNQNAEDALELFRLLRLMSYNLVENLPEKTWANIVEHSENGVMTMDDWLNVYENHIRTHIEQMKRVYDNWKNKV